jgi:hypothetical protein
MSFISTNSILLDFIELIKKSADYKKLFSDFMNIKIFIYVDKKCVGFFISFIFGFAKFNKKKIF